MNSKQIINFMNKLEKLKCNTRHCWTSSGRQESVAEHSWRLAVFAYLVSFNIPNLNLEKLIVMCLVHDLGEVITGDIPTFRKTEEDRIKEKQAVVKLLKLLGEKERYQLEKIFCELEEVTSKEAKVCRALDKLEGILQHNESDIKTWLPIEYKLQLIYGEEDTKCDDFLWECRKVLKEQTLNKIEK